MCLSIQLHNMQSFLPREDGFLLTTIGLSRLNYNDSYKCAVYKHKNPREATLLGDFNIQQFIAAGSLDTSRSFLNHNYLLTGQVPSAGLEP